MLHAGLKLDLFSDFGIESLLNQGFIRGFLNCLKCDSFLG